MSQGAPHDILNQFGLKPLNKTWAKIEILFGLAGAFLGLVFGVAAIGAMEFSKTSIFLEPVFSSGYFIFGIVLFTLGGYLAMAGHRSHLYQSNNQLIAFVIDEIRKHANKESL